MESASEPQEGITKYLEYEVEKLVKKWSNLAHILITKDLAGREFKIIIDGEEPIYKTSKEFGTGCHITVPRRFLGKNARVKLICDDEEK
jgi:putative transposon-encoded protein